MTTDIHKTDPSFVKFFRLAKVEPNVSRVFDRGDYYSVHGADAILVAREEHRTLKSLKFWTELSDANVAESAATKALTALESGDSEAGLSSTALASLNVRAGLELESVLNFLLVEKQRTVHIMSTQGNNKWVATKQASPGNLIALEDVMFSQNAMKEPAAICALFVRTTGGQTMTVGVCSVDTAARTLGVAEFVDDTQLSNVESFLCQQGVKECCLIVDPKNHVQSGIVDLLERVGVPAISKTKKDFSAENVEQDLGRLLASSTRQVNQLLDMKVAMSATAAVIAHLRLLGDEHNHGQYRMKLVDLSQYMRLDSSAIKALNVVPVPGEPAGNLSVLAFLNKCKTAMGSRLLSQWIKQPLLKKDNIEKRLDLVTVFFEETIIRQSLRDQLKRVPDVDRVCRKIVSGKAKLEDLCVLYQFSLIVPGLVEQLQVYDGALKETLKSVLLDRLAKINVDLSKYQQLIEAAVDLGRIADHEFVIQPGYSEELKQLDEKKSKYFRMINQLPEEVAHKLGLPLKKLHLEKGDKLGFYFRITKNDEKTIRAKLVGEFAPFETQKGGVKIRGKLLTTLNDKFVKYSNMYEEHQSEIVQRVMKVAGTYLPVFSRAAELIARVDVFLSMAHVAAESGKTYVRPKIADSGTGDLLVRKGRHPCMEMLDGMSFIPNDIEFRRNSDHFHIITGPNMGGKSTYIRTAGIIVLLAQIGSYVPADEATVCITDKILCRVGAGDSQLRGISTFMAEMLETASILQSATDKSLVIIDELGRGTSTYDGFGLAWAISEDICTRIKCFGFFATHFHEMTALADQISTVRNFHVKALATEGQLAMLYKIEPGPSDQSLGIHVAELAQFPAKVVEMARQKAAELEDFGLHDAVPEETGTEPSTKKRRTHALSPDALKGVSAQDREQAHEILSKFWSKFQSLPWNDVALRDSEAVPKGQELLAELSNSTNPVVMAVLKTASAPPVDEAQAAVPMVTTE